MGNFEILARRLKELRNGMQLTQKEFADKVGFTQATLSAYENNQKKPSLDIVKDIAEKCEVSIDWLLGLSNNKSINNEPKTYGDIVKLFFTLDKALPELIDIKVAEYQNITKYIKESDEPIIEKIPFFADVFIGENFVSEFLFDWKKMMDLLNKGSIDNEVYDLWVEKTLSKYNTMQIKK